MTPPDPCPFGKRAFKCYSYLPSKPIYLSQTTGLDIPQALQEHIWQQALHWASREIEQTSDVPSW